MYKVQIRISGNYRDYDWADSMPSAMKLAKGYNRFGGWLYIRIVKPDGSIVQVFGDESE